MEINALRTSLAIWVAVSGVRATSLLLPFVPIFTVSEISWKNECTHRRSDLGRNQSVVVRIKNSENKFGLQRSEFGQVKTASNPQKFLPRDTGLLFLLGSINYGLVNPVERARQLGQTKVIRRK